MKIAICFAGHLRGWGQQPDAPAAWSHVLKDHSYDVFMHTWNIVGLRKRLDMIEGEWDNQLLVSKDPLPESKIESIWHPTAFACEDQDQLLPSMREQVQKWYQRRDAYTAFTGDTRIKINRFLGNLYMWYSWKQADALRMSYEQAHGITYDIVYRTRPDFWPEVILPHDVDHINGQPWGAPDGMNDWWMTGPPTYITILSSLYDHLEELWEESLAAGPAGYEMSLNPHKLPYRWIVKCGIPLNKWGAECGTLRRSLEEM